jgi:tetratricopeptide (TPR) repeat protein
MACAVFERLRREFPQHELAQRALFERARCKAQTGDLAGAMSDLHRFGQEPLKSSPIAPAAALHLAALLRSQHKAAEAASGLAQFRQQQEPALLREPPRAAWVPLLQYHHGMSLKGAGKPDEARRLLEAVVQHHADHPVATAAALGYGQCLKEQGLRKVGNSRDEGLALLREAVRHCEGWAAKLKDKPPAAEVRARLLYEAAWCCRSLADATRTPEVPLPPDEAMARSFYRMLLADYGELPLAHDARLELAESFAERGDHGSAVALLREGLDKEPPAELADKVRICLGACLAAKGDGKAALAQFDAVARNPKNPLAGLAHLRAGEYLLRSGDEAAAIQRLGLFRDRQPFRDQVNVADRGLFVLGQAHARMGDWDRNRAAFEQLAARFGNSPLANEARYGTGWAWQQQKQYDNAVRAYSRVAGGRGEAAARAQLQTGLCRLEQKRHAEAVEALKSVPARGGSPELSAAALIEAARAHAELKQREPAEKLLQQAIREYPNSKAVAVAKEWLQALAAANPLERHDLLAGLNLQPGAASLPPLPAFGQQQPDRTAPDGTLGEALLATAAAVPQQRKTPAPYERLTLPDPYVHRHASRLRAPLPEEPLPLPPEATGR